MKFCFVFLTTRAETVLRHNVHRAMTPGSNPGRRTTGNGSENHPTERTGHPAPDHDPVVRGGLVWQRTLRTYELLTILPTGTYELRYVVEQDSSSYGKGLSTWSVARYTG